jgi:ABC-2 type transport system ATP-binding protein
MDALAINNLTKRYKSFTLNDISFNLPKGYIMGYVGQNGAGKTTTLDLIMNFKKKDSGKIDVFNLSMTDNEEEYKNSIGYIADECYFPDIITVKEIKGILSDFYSSFNESKFNEFMSDWSLPIDKPIKEFSKGMKIKLTLASVLSRDTKLLILDEPTSGLDPIFRDELLTILQEYIMDGEHSVLFSTHIMSDVEKISDYICFIDNGNIVLNDTKDNIIENHIVVKGGANDLDICKDYAIAFKKTDIGFEALLRKNDMYKFENRFLIEKPTIEDVVIYYTKKLKSV